ncbi:MAG TPA: hypothetical protein PJ982_07750 [Lacipirellulaceae bacterium]|nr:hypothetical protein [Lacipirellulaceae bacterium]
MPVYLFTYHAYLSWLPDRPQGFVRKRRGIQPADRPLAQAYRRDAKHEAFRFDSPTQRQLIEKALAICGSEGYRLLGAASEPTHLHLVVCWSDEQLGFARVRGRIKNLLALDLSRRAGVTGRPWFGGESSRKRVTNGDHLAYLLGAYLPKHCGVQWYESSGWRNLPHATAE